MNDEHTTNSYSLVKEAQLSKKLTNVFLLPVLLAAVVLFSVTACKKDNILPSKPFAMDQANVKTELAFTITEEYKYDYQLNFAKPAEGFDQFFTLLTHEVDSKGVKHDAPIDVSLEVFKLEAGKEQLHTKHNTQSPRLVSWGDTYNKQIYSEKLVPGNYRATLVLNKLTPELAGYKANFSIAETYLGK